MRAFGFVLIAGVVLTNLCCRKSAPKPADPEQLAVQTAAAAVDQFHKDVSTANAEDACRLAGPEAFKGVTQLSCPEFVKFLNGRLGTFISASRPQIPIAAEKPLKVGMEYVSNWKNGQAREHFEFLIHGQSAMLVRYRILSDALGK